MKNVMYMAVTNDEFALPIVVADNIDELSALTGYGANYLFYLISCPDRGCRVHGESAKIIKVNLEDTMARKGKFKALPGDEIIVFSKPRGYKEPIKIHCKVIEISETKLHAVNCIGYNRWLTFASHKKMWIGEDEDDA